MATRTQRLFHKKLSDDVYVESIGSVVQAIKENTGFSTEEIVRILGSYHNYVINTVTEHGNFLHLDGFGTYYCEDFDPDNEEDLKFLPVDKFYTPELVSKKPIEVFIEEHNDRVYGKALSLAQEILDKEDQKDE